MSVLIVNDSFNYSLFSCLVRVKNSFLISFPEFFGQLICGSTRQNKYLFISKSGKPLETRLHIICASNPKCGDKFKISELITSFPTPSPGSLAFTILLMTTRIFFIIITVGKVRDSGTLSYLTDNSSFQTKIKNMDLLRDKDRRFSS